MFVLTCGGHASIPWWVVPLAYSTRAARVLSDAAWNLALKRNDFLDAAMSTRVCVCVCVSVCVCVV